jgi:site-specific DNA-methyltransferase (adenine-specific)
MPSFSLHNADCLDHLRTLEDCSIHSIVTDPPYGLAFMGKRWDYDVPSVEIWAECLRVLKPGGHLLAFAGTRTQHRMACRIEDAGFEIRDMIAWVYGTGFPKSLDVSKAIDKAAGAEREVVGQRRYGDGHVQNSTRLAPPIGTFQRTQDDRLDTAPATPEAQRWADWGTALKPALEPITMARKPLTGTVAANVLEFGTGAINVDGCRVGTETVSTHSRGSNGAFPKRPGETSAEESGRKQDQRAGLDQSERSGRWPANLIHDGSDEVVGLFPEANSARIGNPNNPHRGVNHTATSYGQGDGKETHDYRDSGSAARFFYCAKTSKRERGEGNNHPTVKPIALMAYLCRLVTPPGGIVLDPFMGSGSTGIAALQEGFDFIGIEREAEYVGIAESRIEASLKQGGLS